MRLLKSKQKRIFLMLSWLLAGLCISTTPAFSQLSGNTTARNLRNNVVLIKVTWGNSNEENGFGFIAGERDGRLYIATVNHLVRDIDPTASKRRIEVKFFSAQGEWYKAELLDTVLSNKDLAVIRVVKPRGLIWKKNSIAKERGELSGNAIWFIGRTDIEDKWFVPFISGFINSGPNSENSITVEINSIRVGTSGAPLITETGIVGMVTTDNDAAIVRALHINLIKDAFNQWQYPWELSSGDITVSPQPSNIPFNPSQPNRFKINMKVRADNFTNGWINSGLIVRQGQRLGITASGRISLGNQRNSTPGGISFNDSGKLMRNEPTGALIAVIGDDNDDFIFIGNNKEFVSQRGGILFLGINEGYLDDNTGAYDVNIEMEPTVSRPAGNISVQVRANNVANGWTNTGLIVRRGQRLWITAWGRISLGRGQYASSAGISVVDRYKLMPYKPTGALIAVIGDDNDDFIFIGSNGDFIADRDGILFLGINEYNLNDNSGAFMAIIEYEQAP